MLIFASTIHVLLCVFMIFVILLQPGKDAGMGAALGGGAATSAFGGRGAATFLTKLTAFCAMGFFVTSLGLSFVGLRSSASDDLEEATPTATTPAATPAPSVVPAPSAAPSTPTEAAPVPAPVGNTGSAADAVPADKLPAK